MQIFSESAKLGIAFAVVIGRVSTNGRYCIPTDGCAYGTGGYRL